MNPRAEKILTPEARQRLGRLQGALERLPAWTEAALDAAVRDFAEAEGCKLGDVAQPLRAALSGSNTSPGIFEVMAILGREESLGRPADPGRTAGRPEENTSDIQALTSRPVAVYHLQKTK